MVRKRSRLTWAVTYVLVAAVSAGTLGSILHDVHDAELQPLIVLHDESDHRFSPDALAASGAGDGHCVACHLVRASRGPVSWERTGLHHLEAAGRLLHGDRHAIVAAANGPRPARAPPVPA